MDLLNLWNDDPEEILLDLGFGCDEPDLSGRIPTRFLNFQSLARGITIQVFLEAQKDRLNLENPDVSNRFRQLEVLQLVTKGFSSFMGSTSTLLKGQDLPLDVQERRKRISALFRLASKKSLGQIHNHKTQHTQSIEEVGVPGSSAGEAENSVQSLILTERYQPGSGGSLEEPCISIIPRLAGPGPDHAKVLSDLSVWTPENPGTSPSPPFLSVSLTSSVVEPPPPSPGSSPESSPRPSYTLDLLDVPESNLQTLNKTSATQVQAPPISPSEPKSSCDQSERMAESRSGVQSPRVQFTSVSSVVSTSKPAEFQALDTNTQSTTICAVSHDSEDTTCFAFSLVSSADSSLSPSPGFHQCQFFASTSTPSAPSDASWSKQYTESFISASAWLSSLCLTSPYLHPSSPGFLCPPSLVPQTLIKSTSDRHEGDFIDLSDDSRQINDHVAPSSVSPDAATLEDGNPAMASVASTPPADPDSLKPPADGGPSDPTDHSQQFGVFPRQEIKSALGEVDTLQSGNKDGVNEGQADAQTCTQSETQTAVRSCSLHDERSEKTKQELMEMSSTQNDSSFSSSVFYKQFLQIHYGTVEKPSHAQTESLVGVFETSVDDSDGENGDVDAFCQQLDADEQVYWAEPVQVTPTSEESSGHEDSDGFQFSCHPAAPDSPPSFPRSSSMMSVTARTSDKSSSITPAPFPPPSSTPNLKPSIPHVSVSMSSVLSSHIVSRRDVPYRTESHPDNLHRSLPLDTSTPLRAVQSWADLRIHRITLTKNVSQRSVQTIPNNWSLRAAEATQTPPGSFLVPPSVPLTSHGRRSNSKTGGSNEAVSVWTHVHENGDQDKRWEANQTGTTACCYRCDHQCPQTSHNKQHSANIPYSLDELEEMMMCLQQFHSVFSDIEEQSCEDQAAVYSVLSDTDREDAQTLEKLRCLVKLEAGELEMQLKELAHQYDDSLKAKMHTLLDEQHLLSSQVLPPRTVPTSSPRPDRTASSPDCLPTAVSPGRTVSRGSTTQLLSSRRGISSVWRLQRTSQSPSPSVRHHL